MAIVYMATNLVNGKRYIGVTKRSLNARRKCHIYDAKRKDVQRVFARALRKYGEKKFSWEVIHDYLFIEDAVSAEVRFIEKLKPEYNMTDGGGGISGFTMPESAKAKMSAAHTPERRARASEMFSALWKGKPKPWVGERNKGQANRERARHYGKLHAADFVARHRAVPKGTERIVICLTDGLEFPSASAAARHYGVGKSSIIEHCLGRDNRLTVGGMTFQYKGAPTVHRESRKSKLTIDDVRAIRGLKDKKRVGEIAKQFGVTHSVISTILSGKAWRSVK